MKVRGKLKLLGKIMKKSKKLHVYCLGHYLESSGELLDLSDKMDFDNISTGMRKKLNDEHFGTCIINTKASPRNDPYYNTWGKAVVLARNPKKSGLTIEEELWIFDESTELSAIMDTYVFYPWCSHDTHFANCDCHDVKKMWACVELISPTVKLPKTINPKNITIELEYANGEIILTVYKTNEKLWTKKWKTTLEFPRETSILKFYKFRSMSDVRYKLFISDWIISLLGKSYQYYAVRR
jgi:hypothetical protein